jgi:hypothetical protein
MLYTFPTNLVKIEKKLTYMQFYRGTEAVPSLCVFVLQLQTCSVATVTRCPAHHCHCRCHVGIYAPPRCTKQVAVGADRWQLHATTCLFGAW